MSVTAVLRRKSALLAVAALAFTAPAQAQLFWQPPDLSTPPLTGAEPNSGVNLPGATPEELRAGMLWNLRAALNVAALQCDFEPTLLTTSNYNAMIAHHKGELANAFDKVGAYFKRTNFGAAGQKALDQFGTRTYSSYATVQAQLGFCQTAGKVGREAIFAKRGALYEVAQNRLGELRRSLVPQSDQAFGNPAHGFTASLPSFDKKCWKKGELTKNCKASWDKARGA